MIISYLTEGYFDGSLIFVESLSLVHPEEKILLNSRNLKNKQIKTLHKLHKNLIIDNSTLTISDLSKRHNTSEQEIEQSKKGCLSTKKYNHRLGMNMIADGDRIESYYNSIQKYTDEEYFVLCDIDLLFRKNLDVIFNEMKIHDVGLKLRMGKKGKIPNKLNTEGKQKDALINISTVSIKNNQKSIDFVKTWVYFVNSKPLKERHGIKWGQGSIAKAYNEHFGKLDFFKFRNGTFSPYLREDAPVWFFKSKKKHRDIMIATKELNALRTK